jgi:tRNAThr (cytosine32-N3)-methyltransferase
MIDLEAGSAAATATASGLEEMATLKAAAEAVEVAEAQTDTPSHRSHDPARNLKRSDPFQFGSRYLEAGDDVFEFNAWDHVETDDAYKLYAEGQLEKQRQSPVSDFDKSKFVLPFFFFFPFLSSVL